MSLPQQMTLAQDKSLHIEPIEALGSLRKEAQQVGETVLPANEEVVLDAIKGNTLALEVEIDPQEARWVQLSVLRSPDVWIHPPQKAIFSRRGIKMPGEGLLPAEPLKLRVMVDRNVVGVLANESFNNRRHLSGRAACLGDIVSVPTLGKRFWGRVSRARILWGFRLPSAWNGARTCVRVISRSYGQGRDADDRILHCTRSTEDRSPTETKETLSEHFHSCSCGRPATRM
ncbi:MAG: hypothetical protein HQ567_07235 [Candidatus Nealsonbacteria bacterium]|nr:hypothetical protein [Candidatus Nealsonbacteria bacterium]